MPTGFPPRRIFDRKPNLRGLIRVALWALLLAAAVYTVFASIRMLAAVAHAATPAEDCDVALLLAIDNSGSISPKQWTLMRQGHVEALLNPTVQQALGPNSYVQVTEWATGQVVVAPWSRATPEALGSIAELLSGGAPRSYTAGMGDTTAMGDMMAFAKQQFDELGCARNVLDIITDGRPTGGKVTTEDARKLFTEGMHQVNVLFVAAGSPQHDAEAVDHMERNVRFGWGSFLQPVTGFENIGIALIRKIVLEVSMARRMEEPA